MRQRRVSWRRPGRLTPPGGRGLRGRCVVLARGGVMAWHSTTTREELLLVAVGRIRLDVAGPGAVRRMTVAAGQSVFLPRGTPHRVVNPAAAPARYVYVTGPASGGDFDDRRVRPAARRRTRRASA